MPDGLGCVRACRRKTRPSGTVPPSARRNPRRHRHHARGRQLLAMGIATDRDASRHLRRRLPPLEQWRLSRCWTRASPAARPQVVGAGTRWTRPLPASEAGGARRQSCSAPARHSRKAREIPGAIPAKITGFRAEPFSDQPCRANPKAHVTGELAERVRLVQTGSGSRARACAAFHGTLPAPTLARSAAAGAVCRHRATTPSLGVRACLRRGPRRLTPGCRSRDWRGLTVAAPSFAERQVSGARGGLGRWDSEGTNTGSQAAARMTGATGRCGQQLWR